ncbi:MAG: septum site-determining protein MinC [Lachnospiraceae bacterium]|nr:septum site-determining protein MinC [Lachnospiraceae bacterium]
MASSIVIKSYKNGLSVHMDPEADIETIKADLAAKFRESASFFKDATVAISFEDREIDSQTECDLVNVITSSSDVKVACVAGHNKLTQAMLLNALGELEYKSEKQKDSNVQIIKGTVKDGHIVDVPGSVLILGDVYPGTNVIAGGDVFVLGGLFGNVCAGNNGDPDRMIAALEMNPEKMRIAGIKYRPAEKVKWTIKSKNAPAPKLARLIGTDVVLETIDSNFWKRFSFKDDKTIQD